MVIKRGNNLRNSLSGTTGNDSLFGLGGNDVLVGSNGIDLLDGGTGADRMVGGRGNDTYIVDSAGDRVIEVANQGTDTVRSSVTHTLGANAEHLILTGTKAINGTLLSDVNEIGNSVTGNNAANTLEGWQGHDILVGKGGSDRLLGFDGNDTLLPGAGNGVADIIDGGDGSDTVDYRDALGGVTVNLRANIFAGHAASDVITNVENVIGSRFADELGASGVDLSFAFGGAGNDRIAGNSTAVYDRLRGDDGYDWLFGAENEEDFILQYDRGMNSIFSYRNSGNDHIMLDAEEFGLSLTVGIRSVIDNTEFDSLYWGGGVPGFLSSQRLVFDTGSRVLWADKDGSGKAFDPVPIALFGEASIDPTAADIWLRDL